LTDSHGFHHLVCSVVALLARLPIRASGASLCSYLNSTTLNSTTCRTRVEARRTLVRGRELDVPALVAELVIALALGTGDASSSSRAAREQGRREAQRANSNVCGRNIAFPLVGHIIMALACGSGSRIGVLLR
jgi:hypothetical protein